MDPKGRISLPVMFRDIGGAKWVVTNSRYLSKPCLHFFPLKSWSELENRIAKFPSLNESVQAFQRFYMAGASEIELDAQGRLIVPPTLRKFAQLDSESVCLGLGDKLELWSEPNWTPVFEHLNNGFETVQSQVANFDNEKKTAK